MLNRYCCSAPSAEPTSLRSAVTPSDSWRPALWLQLLHAFHALRLITHPWLVTPAPPGPTRPSSMPTSSSSSSSLPLALNSWAAGCCGFDSDFTVLHAVGCIGQPVVTSAARSHATSTDRQRQSAGSPRRRRKPSLHRPVSRPDSHGNGLSRSFKRHRPSHDCEYNRVARWWL